MGRKSKANAAKSAKKEGFKTGSHSLNPDRPQSHAGQRDRGTIKRLLMYKNSKPQRDAKGKILKPAPFQSKVPSGTQSRVEPNRKWFGNTRVVGQSALQTFQEELGKAVKNPYQVVMRPTKLPVTLLNERAKHQRAHLLDVEKYETTFGPKAQRKKPNVKFESLNEMLSQAETSGGEYSIVNDRDLIVDDDGTRDEAKEWVMYAGQSKRIWNELYKVVDSSDVLLQVLDARDPMGTRCPAIEKFLKDEKPFKHLVFVLNKCDLVPTWVIKKWVAILSHEYPTLAFHASITNSFGKGPLINLLRQFGKLHVDKKQISVGLIGYPNVGKSSIINTLKAKKVVKVAPIPGETKVWQYVTLMNRIYLIDCPGVVYPTGNSETDTVLKGIVRVENLKSPMDFVPAVLERVKPEYIKKTYSLDSFSTSEDLLEQIAKRTGRLFKKAEPDVQTVARMILNDFQRGKLPYFVKPPEAALPDAQADNAIQVKQSLRDHPENDVFDEEDARKDEVIEENDVDDTAETLLEEVVEETQEEAVGESETPVDGVTEEIVADDAELPMDPDVDDLATAKQRKFEEEDKAMGKDLTGKQKRKKERMERQKKVGVHFYENVDVKNRKKGKSVAPKPVSKRHQKRV
ncbi:nucleolar GTP-binding protein 2-like [Paramacrobiotus metropolitanus]|uniref:nucleolar GTP-binding protein 2-like n=1 Tax=Paramacrobiotus metropolitanus TaxID=2943436 RepID=UPI0024457B47|nr:nucleolar GTP-binding protein 2-like [Paramacrobiotus metropolitanus]